MAPAKALTLLLLLGPAGALADDAKPAPPTQPPPAAEQNAAKIKAAAKEIRKDAADIHKLKLRMYDRNLTAVKSAPAKAPAAKAHQATRKEAPDHRASFPHRPQEAARLEVTPRISRPSPRGATRPQTRTERVALPLRPVTYLPPDGDTGNARFWYGGPKFDVWTMRSKR